MVTISDVAKAARVSKKTVSRVINNHPDVAAATREHVQKVIQELQYQPSMLARGLVQGKTNAVGVVINHSAEDVFGYPMYSDNLRGISAVLSANNYDMLVHFVREQMPYPDLYRQRRVDGLILLSLTMDDPHLPTLLASGAPYVLTLRVDPDGGAEHWVDADFESGAVAALDHLVALGHRQIALLTSPLTKTYAVLLLRGYRRALARHGLTLPDDMVITQPSYTSVDAATVSALMARPDPPTAFACSDDAIAVQLMQVLHTLGYRIPDDVSVMGLDDVSFAQYANPPLTTIRQDAYRKGALAADLLLSQINGTATNGDLQRLLPTTLVLRHSTGPAAG